MGFDLAKRINQLQLPNGKSILMQNFECWNP